MKSLSIVSYLGVVVSVAGIIYTSAMYLSLSAVSAASEPLSLVMSGQKIISTKIEAALPSGSNRELVLNELKARHEQYASLYETLTKVITDTKRYVFNGVLMWISIGVISISILIRCEKLRKQK